MGKFKVIGKTLLDEVQMDQEVQESDFAAITPGGNLVQLKYIEDKEELNKYEVTPGIWRIGTSGGEWKLKKTSFVADTVLESFVNVKELTDKMDCFFRNLSKYKEFGIEIPRRAALYWGPAGCGKSTAIISACNNYIGDGKTAAIIWPTDKFDAFEVKEFIKRFTYNGVERLIMVVEDIGGVEMEQMRMKSTASLLSLLDNKEKTFKIPVFIIATTNFPENFLANITNRRGRFDDKIEAKYPDPESRVQLFMFFSKGKLDISDEFLDRLRLKKYNELSPADLQDVVIRSAIYDITVDEALDELQKDIETFKKNFTNKQKLGISMDDDY